MVKINKSKRNLVIILYPHRLRNFDLDRYEINFFKKKFNLEIHDLSKLLYPNFNSSYKKNYTSNKIIKSFKSLERWKNYINKLNRLNKKIFILNFLSIDSFNEFKILLFIKSKNIKRLDFLNFGMPSYFHEKNFISIIENYKLKLKELIYRTRFLLGNLKIRIYRYFFSVVGNFINISPEYLLVAGKKFLTSKNSGYTLVKGSSWDYSRYLRHLKKNENKNKTNIKYDYAVFLANSGPKYPTDSNLYNTKPSETIKNWYGSLNSFFENLEKKFNLKVIVAIHPKAKYEKKLSYLGNRSAYQNSTIELVKNCKLVITSQSTSLSYATIYKKPIFFIYTNETKNDPSGLKYNKFLCKLLAGKLINLNNYSKSDIKSFKISGLKKKYNNYIENYLSSRTDKKANYEIINTLIKNYFMNTNSLK